MVRGLVRVCVYISPEAGGLDVGPDGMDGGLDNNTPMGHNNNSFPLSPSRWLYWP
jgi:hypothetical protein